MSRELRRGTLRTIVSTFRGEARRSQWTGYVYPSGREIELHTLDCGGYSDAVRRGCANLAGTLRQVLNMLNEEYVAGHCELPHFHHCLEQNPPSTAAPEYIRHV